MNAELILPFSDEEQQNSVFMVYYVDLRDCEDPLVRTMVARNPKEAVNKFFDGCEQTQIFLDQLGDTAEDIEFAFWEVRELLCVVDLNQEPAPEIKRGKTKRDVLAVC